VSAELNNDSNASLHFEHLENLLKLPEIRTLISKIQKSKGLKSIWIEAPIYELSSPIESYSLLTLRLRNSETKIYFSVRENEQKRNCSIRVTQNGIEKAIDYKSSREALMGALKQLQ
jgi:hypothetical protein